MVGITTGVVFECEPPRPWQVITGKCIPMVRASLREHSGVLIYLVSILAGGKHRRHRQRHHHDHPTYTHRVRAPTTSPQEGHRHVHFRTTSDVQSHFPISVASPPLSKGC